MSHEAHSAANEARVVPRTHAEEAEHVRPQAITVAVRLLGIVEEVILALIALVLIILAVLLLLEAAAQLFQAFKGNGLEGISAASLTILENVLLVAVIMEIVYTVTLSLRSHELTAEPFLVIGIIASIRRILEITIKSSDISSDTPQFQGLLGELALLSVIVIALAVAMFLVRRSRKFLPESSQT
ncbi:MAG: phosphate-starvation-inducible PsiE family protein [Aggregatilineales bacterium]